MVFVVEKEHVPKIANVALGKLAVKMKNVQLVVFVKEEAVLKIQIVN
jgi:hypothetical protein